MLPLCHNDCWKTSFLLKLINDITSRDLRRFALDSYEVFFYHHNRGMQLENQICEQRQELDDLILENATEFMFISAMKDLNLLNCEYVQSEFVQYSLFYYLMLYSRFAKELEDQL